MSTSTQFEDLNMRLVTKAHERTAQIMTTRIEQDPLGELEVPNHALFGVQTQRAVENFPISGLRPHPAFVWATVLIKKAAAVTHKATGRLDDDLSDAIVSAADEILAGESGRGGGWESDSVVSASEEPPVIYDEDESDEEKEFSGDETESEGEFPGSSDEESNDGSDQGNDSELDEESYEYE